MPYLGPTRINGAKGNTMAEKDAYAHFWSMSRRYFALFIVLTFVILSTTTFFICYRYHATSTEQTLREDRSIATLLSVVLDERQKKSSALWSLTPRDDP
jgi:hypothetical protein